jgi:hypothetical protein
MVPTTLPVVEDWPKRPEVDSSAAVASIAAWYKAVRFPMVSTFIP